MGDAALHYDTKTDRPLADGTCIIEVLASFHGGADRLSPAYLKFAAGMLMRRCVEAPTGQGGLWEGIGMHYQPHDI